MPCPFKVANCDLILSTNKLTSTSLTWDIKLILVTYLFYVLSV